MASRNPQDLHPELRPLFSEWQARCDAAGLDVMITCTYRSNAEQDELYALGRTKKSHVGPWTAARPLGSKVTNARAGQSEHNFVLNGRPASKAWDFVIVVNGKPMWLTDGNGIDDNPLDDATDHLEMWQRAGKIAMDLGLNWYGAPSAPFKEFPHVALKK